MCNLWGVLHSLREGEQSKVASVLSLGECVEGGGGGKGGVFHDGGLVLRRGPNLGLGGVDPWVRPPELSRRSGMTSARTGSEGNGEPAGPFVMKASS